MTATRSTLVFLSYAKEDRRRVLAVYRVLREAGLSPWMDKPPRPWQHEGIPAGEPWNDVIRRKLHEASVVLLFLSRASVKKKGYVQREYRLALDLVLERPPTIVTVIPVLLEPCDVPDLRVDTIQLRDLQWHEQYRSSLTELVQLVSMSVEPAETEPRTPLRTSADARQPQGSLETTALREIAESIRPIRSEGDTWTEERPIALITKAIGALLAGDPESLSEAAWYYHVTHKADVDFRTATRALLQLSDPHVATGAAVVLARAAGGRWGQGLRRADLMKWLGHRVPEVGVIAAMFLAQRKRASDALAFLGDYSRSRRRLDGGHEALRHFVTHEIVPALTEHAPQLAWEVLANDHRLMGFEIRHVGSLHSEQRLRKLLHHPDWKAREVGAALCTANPEFSIDDKLVLMADPEPRVRFRTAEGIAMSAQGEYPLSVVRTFLNSSIASAASRSFVIHQLAKDPLVIVGLLDDPSCETTKPWRAQGIGFEIVEFLDLPPLALRGLVVMDGTWRQWPKTKQLLLSWIEHSEGPEWTHEPLREIAR